MAGVIQPLEVVKGEGKVLRYDVIDNTKGVYTLVNGVLREGSRVDITTASAVEWQAHYPPGSPDPTAVAKALGTGIALLDQTAADTKGAFEVTLTSADTKDLVAKLYKYDVVVVLSGVRRYVVRPSDFRLIEPVNAA
jgi:hypothetical protein